MDDKTDPSPTNPLEMKESEEKEFEALTGESVDKEKKEKVRRKRKPNKKRAGQWRNAKQNTWIYVENLPEDTTVDVLNDVFKRYGVIVTNLDGTPKIKLYRDETGKLKGDASICFLRKESIQLAIQMQDGCPLRYTDSQKVKVSEAIFQKKQNPEFKEREEAEDEKTKKLRWMHLQQQKQSLSWAEGDEEVGGVGLKIIVLENMFSLEEAQKPGFKIEMKSDVLEGCEPFGTVDKITVFDTNPNGIVVVKFKSANAADNCVKKMDGRFFAGRKLKAYFWDGHTDYRVKITEEEENEKLESFANWIEGGDSD
ncbi:hypothetical protein WA171_001749, partial [Blastocystis sp. BT1]